MDTDHHILILDDDAPIYGEALSGANLGVPVTTARSLVDAGNALSDATILVALDHTVNADLLATGKRIQFIQALTTGTDSVQRAISGRSDIVVAGIKGIHGEAMSELALLHMLALQKGYARLLQQQSEKRWLRHRHGRLTGKTVGILGVGHIATTIATRLKAFDMEVIGFSSSPSRHCPGFDLLIDRSQLHEKAHTLDFLLVLIPYSESTRHIVNGGVLNAMKPTAFVINLARGGVLDEDALVRCLEEGRIAGAALDVFAEEPLSSGQRIWDCPNLLITPHIGANSEDYADRASAIVVENVRRYLGDADPQGLLYYVNCQGG